MPPDFWTRLSRRERQIMEIVCRDGRATAAEILAAIPDPPSYSAVRGLLRVLEEKGHLAHRVEDGRNVYAPKQAPAKARRAMLKGLLENFYEGSIEQAVAALLDMRESRLTDEEADRIGRMIDKARKERQR